MKLVTKLATLTATLVLLLSVCTITGTAVNNNTNIPAMESERHINIDPRNYPEDSRERFIASLALKNNMSYEEAASLEAQTVSPRGYDEAVAYKTIDKVAGSINGGSGYRADVYIATEVKYVYSRVTGDLVQILDLGGPIMYIPGASDFDIQGGDFNIDMSTYSGRISCTAAMVYTVPETTVTVGLDIFSISQVSGGYSISTRADTYVINIIAGDLT